jgi:integrase/recombinase XerC
MSRPWGEEVRRGVPAREAWSAVIDGAGRDRNQSLLASRDRAIVALLFGSGIRTFELVGLDVGDLDLEEGVARLRGGRRRPPREAPVSVEALELIEAYLDERPECEEDQPLFVSRQGGRLTTRQVQNLFKRAGRQSGYGERLHPHLARHANALRQVTKALEKGRALREVAENLGHFSTETLGIYRKAAGRAALWADPAARGRGGEGARERGATERLSRFACLKWPDSS